MEKVAMISFIACLKNKVDKFDFWKEGIKLGCICEFEDRLKFLLWFFACALNSGQKYRFGLFLVQNNLLTETEIQDLPIGNTEKDRKEFFCVLQYTVTPSKCFGVDSLIEAIY